MYAHCKACSALVQTSREIEKRTPKYIGPQWIYAPKYFLCMLSKSLVVSFETFCARHIIVTVQKKNDCHKNITYVFSNKHQGRDSMMLLFYYTIQFIPFAFRKWIIDKQNHPDRDVYAVFASSTALFIYLQNERYNQFLLIFNYSFFCGINFSNVSYHVPNKHNRTHRWSSHKRRIKRIFFYNFVTVWIPIADMNFLSIL